MSLGDQFVDGTSADWSGVGRAFAGSILSGVFLAVISFIDQTRAILISILGGIESFLVEFIPAMLAPSGLDEAWRSAGDAIGGFGPLSFVIAVVIAGVSVWIGVTTLIVISRRLLP